MEYRVVFTKQAVKDAKKLDACGLDKKAIVRTVRSGCSFLSSLDDCKKEQMFAQS